MDDLYAKRLYENNFLTRIQSTEDRISLLEKRPLSVSANGGSSATAAGNAGNVQYKDLTGVFAGSDLFDFNPATPSLSLGTWPQADSVGLNSAIPLNVAYDGDFTHTDALYELGYSHVGIGVTAASEPKIALERAASGSVWFIANTSAGLSIYAETEPDNNGLLLSNTEVYAYKKIRTPYFVSDVVTGTAPLQVTSTTLNPNLNADKWDSQDYPLTTLGDVLYGGASGVATRLAGNTTATNKFLRSVSGGAPSWEALAIGDLPSLANTKIWVGNGSNIATAVSVSGDATLANTGALTVTQAAKWTTARTLAGNSVDGSANVAFANKFIVQGTADAGLSAAQFLGALATGIVKNTTTTGVLSIAVAGDFPTLNQNTTGSAATLSPGRNIYGNAFNGSADLTQIIASTYGGTGNGFTKISGPTTAEKTFNLPNSSDTIATYAVANVFTETQQITVPTATKTGLTIQTSDNNTTKNLFELKSSSGAILVSLGGTGRLSLSASHSVSSGSATVNTLGATLSGTNSGTSVQQGTVFNGTTSISSVSNNYSFSAFVANAISTVGTSTTPTLGLIGFTGNSSNNGGGDTPLVGVRATGAEGGSNSSKSTHAILFYASSIDGLNSFGRTVTNLYGFYNSGGVGDVLGNSLTDLTYVTNNYAFYSEGGQSRLKAGVATTIPLVLQGAASQSANLTEWQNSSASVLARINGAGRLGVSSNTSTTLAKVGGAIFDHFADVNNGTTVETDLYTDTLAANTFSTNGDKVKAHYQLVCTGAALSTQQMRIYFGGTLIYDTGTLAIGAVTDNFTFDVEIMRVSSSVVRCSVSVATDFGTLFPYSKYTEITGLTLSNTQVLKITGQAAGAAGASNQITAKEGSGYWFPAA